MPIAIEELLDIRRLRRKVSLWRLSTFAVLAVAVISLLADAGVFSWLNPKNQNHIARVSISGFISDDRDFLKMLHKLGKNPKVKAVILSISSPGGTTVGGEAVYEAVRKISKKKPVVTSVGTLAASAGYMVAAGSDYIVARRSSMVGSIGVILQYPDTSALLEKLGVKVNAIKSTPLKAEPSPFHPTTPEAREMMNKVIQDSYRWFVNLVSERRKLDATKMKTLADGSVFTGSQGLANGLVDAIGDEETAKQWLVDKKSIKANLKVITWTPEKQSVGLFSRSGTLIWMAELLGFSTQNPETRPLGEYIGKQLFLDGLQSVWLTGRH